MHYVSIVLNYGWKLDDKGKIYYTSISSTNRRSLNLPRQFIWYA